MKKTKILALLMSMAMLSSTAMPGTLAISSAEDGTPEYVCGFEEHTHDEYCWEAELTCTEKESAGHTHDEECYTVETVLNCDLTEEPHECTEECEEDCGITVEHVHGDECPTEEKETLTCGKEETEGHTHGGGCYGEAVLVCTTEEHTHTDECVPAAVEIVDVCTDCGVELTEDAVHNEGCPQNETIVEEDAVVEEETFTFEVDAVEASTATSIFWLKDGIFNVESENYIPYSMNNESAPCTIKRGETKLFLYSTYRAVDNIGTWTFDDTTDGEYLRLEVYKNTIVHDYNHGSNLRNAYLKLTALKPTEKIIKLKFTHHTSGTVEYFYIKIEDDENTLYIEDNIATTGCLTAKFKDGSYDDEMIEYVWTKSGGKDIDDHAIDGNSVNVVIDKGGIDKIDIENSQNPMKTYTVEAKNKDTKEVEGKASYAVPYGNEILNGSFEYPMDLNEKESNLPGSNYPNGTTGMYWRTTGLGEYCVHSPGRTKIGQDMEILRAVDGIMAGYGIVKLAEGFEYVGINESNGTIKIRNSFGEIKEYAEGEITAEMVVVDTAFPHGHHCAEINADAPGALYQDVLTNPGAEMYWSLAHRGRNSRTEHGWFNKDGLKVTVNGKTFTDQKDYMYVIIAPTEQVKHITTQDQLDKLIDHAKSEGMSKAGAYEYHDSENNIIIKYSIWEVADDHTAWGKHTILDYEGHNTYTVGDNQYLTRFFFAAGETAKDRDLTASGKDKTYANGNFIDDIYFSENLPYTIAYYLDGELQSGYTETGMKKVGERIEAGKTDQFTGKFLLQTTVNDIDNNGNTFINSFGAGKNVLKLYYVSYGIKIKKTVQIEEWDKLNQTEQEEIRELFEDYTATFQLKDKCGDVISETTVELNSENFTGTAEFLGNDGKSINPVGNTYTIIETEVFTIDGLGLIKKAEDITQIVGENEFFIEIEAINVYNARNSLTIEKEYEGSVEDENQSFLFNVKGMEDTITADIDLVVRVAANDSVTIENLPLGLYTVTELQEWSWRYTLSSIKDTNNTSTMVKDGNVLIGARVKVDSNGNTVTFTNTRDEDQWLSGDCYADNWFGGINGTIDRNRRKYD